MNCLALEYPRIACASKEVSRNMSDPEPSDASGLAEYVCR